MWSGNDGPEVASAGPGRPHVVPRRRAGEHTRDHELDASVAARRDVIPRWGNQNDVMLAQGRGPLVEAGVFAPQQR